MVSNIATPSDAVTATLYIGKDNPAASASGGYYFKGSMDDVRIYGRALSGAEVQQLRGSIN